MILLLVQIKQDKKEDKLKIRTQQYIKLNTIAKKIYRLNPSTPDDRRHTQQKNPTISSIGKNLSQICLRILGLTHGRAIKEESKDKDLQHLKLKYEQRNPTIKPQWAWQRPKHHPPTISSIIKSKSEPS